MANKSGSIEQLAIALGNALAPLESRLASGNVLELFAEMGVQFPSELTTKPGMIAALSNTASIAAELHGDVADLISAISSEDSGEILAKSVTLISDIEMLINSFDDLESQLNANAGSLPGIPASVVTDFATDFGSKLLDFMLIVAIENIQPEVAKILPWTGIIDRIPQAGADDGVAIPPFIQRRLRLDRFGDMFKDPGKVFSDLYGGWGSSSLNGATLLAKLDELFRQMGVISSLIPAAPATPTSLSTGAFTLHPTSSGITVDVSMATPGGIDFPWALSDDWTLNLKLTPALDAGVQITITPPASLSFQPSSGSISGEALVELIGDRSAPDAFLLIGQASSSRLQVGRIKVGLGLEFSTTPAAAEPIIEFEVGEGKVVIDMSSGDSFIGSLLSSANSEVNFELAGRWTPSEGMSFQGSATIEIAIPAHVQIGPIEIINIYLVIGIKDTGVIPIELSTSISSNLGPLQASVERIGLLAELDFPSGGGNLGPANLEMKFKPPNGVGLSLDAGVIKGGGYLFFDTDREEYAGALELVFSEWIALKAIGLITTKMPDGSKGFSLLVIITAEFGSGIQLGFGFTLLGVGGLLGLNRMVNIEPLKDGIRTGVVESVMFPQDVVANAPRIISDLRRFFPPVRDIFLVGPMAKIGWGTPTLISASLGVILEFPSVNITILGVVKVVLPDEKKDILRLQVNFIGRLEPSNKLLWFYAELYDSRVLSITLEGGMGLLVNWGDNANFVVSVGGFHPRYSPPPLPFPEPPRLTANILNESWAKVRIEGYFAVTSNSVQFGARAELYFGLSEFRLEGHLGFDALFQFNPFFFSFSLSFSLSVKVFGLGLWSVGFSGLLEGPTPWHIKGKGKISLFFFSISVPFEHTWGGRRETALKPIEVFPLLKKEFSALTNWEAVVPTNSNLLVSLRKLGETGTDQLVLHPVGKLRISQRKVPLDFKLDKVGNQRPADVQRVSVDAAIPGGGSLSISEMEEKFAIGQFKDLDDSDRLSSPAFEPMESGIEIAIAGEQMKTSQAVKRVIRYETIIIDNNFKRHVKNFFVFFTTGFAVLYNFLFGHFLKGNAVTKSVLSQHHKKRIQPFEEVIHIQPNQYSVVFNSNNRPVDAGAVAFTSQAKAMEYMQQQIQSDPTLANNLHVIPNSEVNLAA